MPRAVVSDASCLIVLTNIGELELLHQLYNVIYTTPLVVKEYGKKLPEWIVVQQPKDLLRQKLIELQVDSGEASAISLALEFKNSIVILDDYKARKVAEHLKMIVTGTIGIIIRAKKRGLIELVKPLFERIEKAGFYVSNEIINYALKEAGEKEKP
ncbi:MAG: DUF3368 domain-containing protein [Bacteroidia bacterium]